MKQPPNILWIVSDATRYDHLSCYGYNRPTTPHLEKLAERATVYETAIGPASWSLPSYTTLLTGLYPSQHGVNTRRAKLPAAIPTLPQHLHDTFGYRTACFTANPFVTRDFGLARGFQEHQLVKLSLPMARSRWRLTDWGSWQDRVNSVSQYLGLRDSGAGEIVSAAKRFLSEAAGPWFVLLVLVDAHAPYAPPLKWALQATRGVCEVATHCSFSRSTNDPYRFMAKHPSSADWDRLIRLYDAEISYVDWRIGQLVSWLDGRGLYDETLLVISADHGETLGERGKIGHVAIGESLVHVPLIVKSPGQAHSETIADVVEVRHLSTALMAGEEADVELPVLDCALSQNIGGRVPEEPADHWQVQADEDWHWDRTTNLLRTREWEYLEYEDGTRELFQIREDPCETTNLLHEKPEVASQLQHKLQAKLQSIETAAPAEESEYAEISPEVERRLRDLGYL